MFYDNIAYYFEIYYLCIVIERVTLFMSNNVINSEFKIETKNDKVRNARNRRAVYSLNDNLMNGSGETTCDCFAHKGNHSKCGNGCHRSGPKGAEGEGSAWNGWDD